MESAEDVDQANHQQPKPSTTHEHAAGAEDLISGLCDDVLLRILGLETKDGDWDAARTGVLSRRWRGLWTRVPALRFSSTPWSRYGWSAERFIAFVDSALARRVQSGDGVEHLDISFVFDDMHDPEQVEQPSVAAAEKWIWYAMQRGVKSFVFELDLPLPKVFQRDDDDEEEDNGEEVPVISLDDLPSSATLETMSLDLEGIRMRLPATAVFTSLVDLKFEYIQVEDSSGHLLSRIVSSACCPCLRKLRLSSIEGAKELVVEASALTDLSLEFMHETTSLKIMTPNLRVLCIQLWADLKALTVSAPKLEHITSGRQCWRSLLIDIHPDLSCVSSLELSLWSHASLNDAHKNLMSISLLQHCQSARCLDVHLFVPPQFTIYPVASQKIDIIKDKIPRLCQVTYLKVHISPGWTWHSFGDCIANFLSKFTNLRYLHLNFGDSRIGNVPFVTCWKSDSVCNHWKFYEFSSLHLEEVEFKGVTGTECELRFLKFMLAGAIQLRKAVLNFSPDIKLEDQKDDDFHRKLLGHGIWTDNCGDYRSCEWRPC